MNLTLNFKERHLCYFASIVSQHPGPSFFDLLVEIRTKLKAAVYLPTDLVSTSIGADDLSTIYRLMVDKKESECAGINTDIRNTLNPQLDVIIADDLPLKPEATIVKNTITTINSQSATTLANQIQSARTWLNR